MKRILSVLMLVLAVALFANCGGDGATDEMKDDTKKAMTKMTPEQEMEKKKSDSQSNLDKMLEEANQYKKLADKYNAAGNSTKAARFQKLYNTAKSNYDTAKAAHDKMFPAK